MGIGARGLPVVVRMVLRGFVHLKRMVTGLGSTIFNTTGLWPRGLVAAIALWVCDGAGPGATRPSPSGPR
jgi:hypothetical protein